MGLRSVADTSNIIQGNYTPSTMPDPTVNARKLAYDVTYNCFMMSDGTQWRKPSYDVWTDYSGVTNASGDYTVTYATPKSVVPFVAPVLSPNLDSSLLFRLASSTVNGFTVKCEQRASLTVLGINLLSFAVTNVNNQPIKVVVKDLS